MQIPRFIGLHAVPPKWLATSLGLLPFVLLIIAYIYASDARLAENPQDKLLPSFTQMYHAIERMAFEPDKRSGDYLLWKDSQASLIRLASGVGLSFLFALIVGLNTGLYPGVKSIFNPMITFISMIPPLALLPILFIALGVDEFAKIALIFIGTAPLLTRDIYLAVQAIPNQQKVKALTLGATSSALVYRIILPQILPRALDSLRLVLGGAWLFLIAAEAIAATEGLGYRIFLVRRYLAMDVIIPYVFWITFLGFLFDWALRSINKHFFPWYEVNKD
jgi:NitT/TauT family transport system permease protein